MERRQGSPSPETTLAEAVASVRAAITPLALNLLAGDQQDKPLYTHKTYAKKKGKVTVSTTVSRAVKLDKPATGKR